MILDILYLSLIGFAIIALQAHELRKAVIYLSVFSLICSIVYLLLGAPDVAIAEATIGCTLSTILYLVALKKYKIFTVYYNSYVSDDTMLESLEVEREEVMAILLHFTRAQELQLDLITTSTSFTKLKDSSTCDVVIFHNPNGIWLHGVANSYQYNILMEFLRNESTLMEKGKFIEGEDWTLRDLEEDEEIDA